MNPIQTLCCKGVLLIGALTASFAFAASLPDQLIQNVGNEVIQSIQADPQLQAGNLNKIVALVETKVMPIMRFERMTAMAVGPAWRSASPEQQQRLQQEFKILLIRTYANAFRMVKDKSLIVRPLRFSPQDTQVIVKSEVRGAKGEVVNLDYRLMSDNGAWFIVDINVMGLWLIESYRTQFSSFVTQSGVNGLIDALSRLNGSRSS